MPALQSILQNNPEFGKALLEMMSHCDGMSEFGVRVASAAANALMSAEADKACGAALGERSEERTNSRNGYRPRTLKCNLGDVDLKIPKLRKGTYYPDSLLSRWSRVDASLAALVVEAYTKGVSTRAMSSLAQVLGISSLSSSEVSRLTAALDEQVQEMRERSLSDQKYCYLWIDATYVRCRVEGHCVSQAVVSAIALGQDGHKHLVGLDCVDTESYEDWKVFLASLKARGISGVVVAISDAHTGLVRALGEIFQGVGWQRCTIHLQRDARACLKRKSNERVVGKLLTQVFSQTDELVARALYPKVCKAISGLGEPKAAALLESAQEDAQCYLSMPHEHWRRLRTNNIQERANREIKRRYRSVQTFPSRESLMRLVGAVMLEEDDVWAQRREFTSFSVAQAWEPHQEPAPDGTLACAIAQAECLADEIIEATLDLYAPKS